MKRKLMILMALSLFGVVSAGIGAATYAGFKKEAEVSQMVGMQRYLFLDVSNDWETANAEFYVYLFNMTSSKNSSSSSSSSEIDISSAEASDAAEKQWYKGTKYKGSIYWFFVPTKYEGCVFVRANPDAALSDIYAWDNRDDDGDAKAIWNQTVNLTLKGNDHNYFHPTFNNSDYTCPCSATTSTLASVSEIGASQSSENN